MSWAREVEAQERDLGVFFDTIIVCAVTGSTQAGMIAGFADRERARRVVGIDASAKPDETRAQVQDPGKTFWKIQLPTLTWQWLRKLS